MMIKSVWLHLAGFFWSHTQTVPKLMSETPKCAGSIRCSNIYPPRFSHEFPLPPLARTCCDLVSQHDVLKSRCVCSSLPPVLLHLTTRLRTLLPHRSHQSGCPRPSSLCQQSYATGATSYHTKLKFTLVEIVPKNFVTA
jgi:hypothetical protein